MIFNICLAVNIRFFDKFLRRINNVISYNLNMITDTDRLTSLNDQPISQGGRAVVYWMQADQRAEDNWALIRAVELGNELELPVVVAFFVHDQLKHAYVRHYNFMLQGLAQTAGQVRSMGLGFVMRIGDPRAGVPKLADELGAAVVVTDQSYLNWGRAVRRAVADDLSVRLEAVDASTVYPPGAIYPKAAYGAYILRPKLRAARARYLTDYPKVQVKVRWAGDVEGFDERDVEEILGRLSLDSSVGPVALPPGPVADKAAYGRFVAAGFARYDTLRNDPVADVTSHLSAYLHFGQISAQRVAYDVLNSPEYDEAPDAAEAFLDELITWRELAVNNVFYSKNYNNIEGIPAWGSKTLAAHADDPREFIYSRSELEEAKTHDELWNAAQQQMLKTGRMHGYLRMYWAKKVLEWSPGAETAIEHCIYLNDKYFLDGRDPNGYAGILWAIGGLHDRPWFDRDICGQVRYMSYGGAKGKFDVAAYIERWL